MKYYAGLRIFFRLCVPKSSGRKCARLANQPADQAEIAWKHIEVLASHRSNPELHVPNGSKLLLALHVLDDPAKQSDARALSSTTFTLPY